MAKFEEELELLLKCKTPIIEVVSRNDIDCALKSLPFIGNNLDNWGFAFKQ